MDKIKLFLPDESATFRGKLLAHRFAPDRYDIVSTVREAESADIVAVNFFGRNKISPKTYLIISELTNDAPIVGFEGEISGNKNWPAINMDLQFTSEIPDQIILFSIRKVTAGFRKRREYEDLKVIFNRQVHEVETLVETGIGFTAVLSRHELYSQIIEKTVMIIPAEYHLFYLISEKTFVAELVASRGIDLFKARIPPIRRLKTNVLDEFKALQKPIYATAPFAAQNLIRIEAGELPTDVQSVMISPIISKERLLGFIEIVNRRKFQGFTDEDCRRLEVLSDFAAVALENAYLYERTEHIAQIDDLTRVQNFQFAHDYLEKLIQTQDRFIMLFLDLDGFKQVNSKYGHLKGNDALRKVSGIIRRHLGASDLACRFGGDEFMLILPGVKMEAAENFARDIIREIENERMFPDIKLSASIGLAAYPSDGISIREMIHAADSAMYYAKAKSHGEVITYQKYLAETGEEK